ELPRMSKRRSLVKRLFTLLVVLVLAAVVGAWLLLRASLPRLDGDWHTAGLKDAATIERDALGVATVRASTRRDAAYALGFVHAQERYFEMDLMRRAAAGELSELVGAAALPTDKQRRPFRMRAGATEVLATLSADETQQLEAYRDGVNAGLAALSSRPWEYWL